MAEDYPRTLLELEQRFADDAACREYLFALRWPDGFVCPRCGDRSAWPTGRGLWLCGGCRHQTSVTAGTILQGNRVDVRFADHTESWPIDTSAGHGRYIDHFVRVLDGETEQDLSVEDGLDRPETQSHGPRIHRHGPRYGLRELRRNHAMQPHDTTILFDGTSLDNWVSEAGGPATWDLEDGAMTVTENDILTTETFRDAAIRLEFRVPYMPEAEGQWRGNSGVFIHGLYEVQVLDSSAANVPGTGDCGAFYNMHAPLVNACKPPREWQSLDIYFRAPRGESEGGPAPARATVLLNDVLIHNNVELPEPTAKRIRQGFDPDPLTPGPLLLQCHGSGDKVSYRNIWLQHLPLKGSEQYGPS